MRWDLLIMCFVFLFLVGSHGFTTFIEKSEKFFIFFCAIQGNHLLLERVVEFDRVTSLGSCYCCLPFVFRAKF